MLEEKRIANMNPVLALLGASILLPTSAYMFHQITPVFFRAMDTWNGGAGMSAAGIALLGLLALYGSYAFLIGLLGAALTKRTVDAL